MQTGIERFRLFCKTKMKIKVLLLCAMALTVVSCANKSTFLAYSSFAEYKYATIDDSKDGGGDASLMHFRIRLQQALRESGLEEIKKDDIDKLSEEQKKQLMLLQLSGSQSENNSVATINAVDYTTERVLGSCNGLFGLSFSTYGDMNGSIKKSGI